MTKKVYVCPATEIMDLRAMNAMMQGQITGPASPIPQPGGGAPRFPGDIIG